MIIGVSGLLASGKGQLCKYLESKGYACLSLSDIIRLEILFRKQEITRESLQKIGNELRQKFGSDVLTKRVFHFVEADKNYVIDSIRNISEVEYIKKSSNNRFMMIWVDSDIKLRVKRINERNREKDPTTLKDLKATEKKEFSKNVHEQQMGLIRKKADVIITNNSTLEEFHKKIEKVLQKEIPKYDKYIRPSWDEYFMEIMKTVSKRSTCDRGRTSAIIVKDKRIIATGYAGSPPGTEHCDEVGHLLEDGHCVRTIHSEHNALLQAAVIGGASTQGSTLYTLYSPCIHCCKYIVAAGVSRIVLRKMYRNDGVIEYLENAGVDVCVYEPSEGWLEHAAGLFSTDVEEKEVEKVELENGD